MSERKSRRYRPTRSEEEERDRLERERDRLERERDRLERERDRLERERDRLERERERQEWDRERKQRREQEDTAKEKYCGTYKNAVLGKIQELAKGNTIHIFDGENLVEQYKRKKPINISKIQDDVRQGFSVVVYKNPDSMSTIQEIFDELDYVRCFVDFPHSVPKTQSDAAKREAHAKNSTDDCYSLYLAHKLSESKMLAPIWSKDSFESIFCKVEYLSATPAEIVLEIGSSGLKESTSFEPKFLLDINIVKKILDKKDVFLKLLPIVTKQSRSRSPRRRSRSPRRRSRSPRRRSRSPRCRSPRRRSRSRSPRRRSPRRRSRSRSPRRRSRSRSPRRRSRTPVKKR
jgi:hypothetical protein